MTAQWLTLRGPKAGAACLGAMVLAAFVACGAPVPTTMPDGSPIERFQLRGPGYLREMTFDGSTLANPNTNLQRFPDGIRGRVGNVDVFLTTKPGQVNGTLGAGAPVDLKVESGPEGAMKANGLWGGRPSRLQLSHDKLILTFAACGYDLTRKDGTANEFTGQSGCQAGLNDLIELVIPKAVLSAPPEERATWVITFLSR